MSGYLYLFFQIWVWIVIAFILGALTQWFFCCRNKDEQKTTLDLGRETSTTTTISAPVTAAAVATNTIDESWKPQGFSNAPDNVDDLKRIKGVGAVIEKTLNELGIYQFEQIQNWDNDNVSWVENFLAFPGRVKREGWIDQSKTLGSGGTTEFAKRVDKGDVNYT